jgi:serine phosphatase RsbU (regulator of sigma subunit)
MELMADRKSAQDGRSLRAALLATQRGDPRLWAAAMFAVASLIALVDAFVVGEHTVLIPVLIVPVTIAAARCKPEMVQGLAIYSVLLAIVLGLPNDFFMSTDHVIRTSVVAAVGVLSVYLARVRASAEELQQRAETSLRRSSILAAAGVLLDISLNPEVTLSSIARLASLEIAEWASVDMAEPDGSLTQMAVAHRDPQKVKLTQELRRRYPPDPAQNVGIYNVMRTGESEFYPALDGGRLDQLVVDSGHRDLVESLGATSAIVVPMVARRRTLGALTLVTAGDRPCFTSEDLSMVEELASRCALAIDNARLYNERGYIARTLQQSLLPPELPDLPRLEAAARFRAAGEGIEVGGDFYDLFDTGRGVSAAVMGDVCGKGADAAALTALARYTIRTAAMADRPPSQILEMLNDAILRQRSDKRFCTVTYAQMEERHGSVVMTVASGGHPLPYVLRADGSVETVGRWGTLLGVVPDPELNDTEVELKPGDTLLLYTDGVIEARSDDEGMFGANRLAELLESCAGRDPDTVAQRIEDAVVNLQNGDPKDDIAILALRVRPAAVQAGTGAAAA